MLKIAGMLAAAALIDGGCAAAQACRGLERLGEAPGGGRDRGDGICRD